MPTTERRNSERILLCVTVSVVLLFVVLTTVFIALQGRQAIAQSARMDELEGSIRRLSRRVDVLEKELLTARDHPSRDEGGRGDANTETRRKDISTDPTARKRRQFSSYCPCVQGPPGPPGPPGKQGPPGSKGDKGDTGSKGKHSNTPHGNPP
ncbi:collagen alpha-1(XXVI) chain-like [Nematostella vectensis]|uniref:collagen alpha-1(XXVI) chain-like n=1 Tax=Nematostella vectensis TaxID=45351 RepID=UPI002076E29B|nr:collagen alpha-1(XXVI) chain-like [Nematostella vectensis]